MFGNLDLSILDNVVETALWGELLLELDLLGESLCIGKNSVEVGCGLSAPIFSSVLVVGGTVQVPWGNWSYTG